MKARGANIVRILSGSKRRLGGDQHFVATAFDRRAQHFLRCAIAMNIGAIEHGEAMLQADVNEASGFGCVCAAPGCEAALPPKGAGAKSENRNIKTGTS